MSNVAAPTDSPPAPKRPLSLGVIFLTLYIDLIGFSIVFPLGPALLEYYLKLGDSSGMLASLVRQSDAAAHAIGQDQAYAAVLFGGIVSSFFSILQFIFSPIWGSTSDRRGRRNVLLNTIAGTALGYAVWIFSGSFWLFLLSRLVTGAFSGNISVATAAVADVTTRGERSKAMGIVGAAFGLGLVTGPMVGAFTSQFDLLKTHPDLARYGINPFSVPAMISFGMCLLNLFWVSARFKETISLSHRNEARETRTRNPLRAIFSLDNVAVRRTNLVAFVFSIAFVAMESMLTFLATKRFGYTTRSNGYLLGFLGFWSIVTQGFIVRRVLKHTNEIRVLSSGLIFSSAGLLCIGLASHQWLLYGGLALLAIGAGLVNPSTSGLISLYSKPHEQGRVIGIFRSLGSLARAITPILAGVVFFSFGSASVFYCGAVFAAAALALSTRLPTPEK